MTTIAAVIPLYNKAAFIERALASVLFQTRPVDEILVVDDSSTDGGMAVVSEYAAAHPTVPFRLLTRTPPGAGGYAARNLAIESARSSWIAFLDADDEWAPGHIETVCALAETHGVGAIGASRHVIRGEVQTTHYATPSPKDQVAGFDEFVRVWLKRRDCPFWTSATAIRRDILLEAGLFPARRCRRGGDKDLWLRVVRHTPALLTRFVGATYHNEDEAQVTRRESTNQQHCLAPTLQRLISEESGETRQLLIRLLNMEIFHYAKYTLGRAPIAPESYRAFRVESDPLTYLLILSAAHAPLPWLKGLRTLFESRQGAG